MPEIYHITTASEWAAALAQGSYSASSLSNEGFIHCSNQQQLDGVLQRYFSGISELVKLSIETEKLTSPFYFDWSPSLADTFPHIYGPINLDAVTRVEAVN